MARRAQPAPPRSATGRPDTPGTRARGARRDTGGARRQFRVILWRVLPWDPAAGPHDRGGPLHIPRGFQGAGRHDNPARYGCLYATVDAVSGVAEILAQFRGEPLVEGMLDIDRTRLAAAPLELPDGSELIDLDEPRVLHRERLRPSSVATRERT